MSSSPHLPLLSAAAANAAYVVLTLGTAPATYYTPYSAPVLRLVAGWMLVAGLWTVAVIASGRWAWASHRADRKVWTWLGVLALLLIPVGVAIARAAASAW